MPRESATCRHGLSGDTRSCPLRGAERRLCCAGEVSARCAEPETVRKHVLVNQKWEATFAAVVSDVSSLVSRCYMIETAYQVMQNTAPCSDGHRCIPLSLSALNTILLRLCNRISISLSSPKSSIIWFPAYRSLSHCPLRDLLSLRSVGEGFQDVSIQVELSEF